MLSHADMTTFTHVDPATTPPGRVETATYASGVTLGYRYDNLYRVTAVTYPDTVYSGGEPTAKYQRTDYSGCCTQMVGSTTDRAGRTTTYTHDALKRITQVNSPEGTFKFCQRERKGDRLLFRGFSWPAPRADGGFQAKVGSGLGLPSRFAVGRLAIYAGA